MNRTWTIAIVVMAMAAGSVMLSQGAARTSPGLTADPVLENTCLITTDVKSMVEFYERILHRKASWSGGEYAEFATGAGTLAIFSADAQERYIPGSAQAANNKSVILEFKVTDVDAEYLRIKELVKMWVKPPTTQPWGTRSIYFRDPDGNLVDFFSRVRAS